MVAFNFKKVFASDVESGIKTQTIRSKKRCKIGDNVQLYTGMRTKSCRKLADSVCIGTAKIEITEDCPWRLSETEGEVHVRKDDKSFVELDGFKNAKEFVDFFRKEYGLPYTGYVHVWRDPKYKNPMDINSPSSICSDCAEKLGGEWPEGHCATFWTGECGYCNQKKMCCCVTDYKWDKQDSFSGVREF